MNLYKSYPTGILCIAKSKTEVESRIEVEIRKIRELPQSIFIQAMSSPSISLLVISLCITAAVLHIIDALRWI